MCFIGSSFQVLIVAVRLQADNVMTYDSSAEKQMAVQEGKVIKQNPKCVDIVVCDSFIALRSGVG
jgi:uncharacterized protein YijF (DUF1287 family)